MAKQMMFENVARQQILQGVAKLAGAVKVTMGPTGRNVISNQNVPGPLQHRLLLRLILRGFQKEKRVLSSR